MSVSPAASSLTELEMARPLAGHLFRGQGSPAFGRVPVSVADFTDVTREPWRGGYLSGGRLGLPLSAPPMRLAPILADGSDARCAGLSLELTLLDSKASRSLFTFHCLRHVAERATAQLVDVDVLKPGETRLFDVVVGERQMPFTLPSAAARGVRPPRSRSLGPRRLPSWPRWFGVRRPRPDGRPVPVRFGRTCVMVRAVIFPLGRAALAAAFLPHPRLNRAMYEPTTPSERGAFAAGLRGPFT
jgi:hypothetical protein